MVIIFFCLLQDIIMENMDIKIKELLENIGPVQCILIIQRKLLILKWQKKNINSMKLAFAVDYL